MQSSLIRTINTKQFLSTHVKYPSSRDPTSKMILYHIFTKILTEQCGLVMSRWALECLEIDWYLLI